MVETLGWKEAVGQTLKLDNQTLKVRVVLRDFHEKTVMKGEKVRPVLIRFTEKENFNYLSIKVQEKDLEEVNAFLKKEWLKFSLPKCTKGFINKM